MPDEGIDMGWLHMLKLSSMSNRKSDSNCMVMVMVVGAVVIIVEAYRRRVIILDSLVREVGLADTSPNSREG